MDKKYWKGAIKAILNIAGFSLILWLMSGMNTSKFSDTLPVGLSVYAIITIFVYKEQNRKR